MAIAHAICGSLASLIVIPTAILIARNRNKLHSNSLNWFKLHSSLNYLGAILLVITFVLGVGAVASAGLGNQFSGPNSDIHHQAGLGIFILLLLQVILGIYAHKSSPSNPTPSSIISKPTSHSSSSISPPSKKSYTRNLHQFLGIVTSLALYSITYHGLHIEWSTMSDSLTDVPDVVQVLFWILTGGAILGYLLSYGNEKLRSLERGVDYELVDSEKASE